MQADPDYPRALAVELRVQRDSVGVIFKTIIPVFAQALLSHSGGQGRTVRTLSVLALGGGCGRHDGPTFLGLPAHVEGMQIRSVTCPHPTCWLSSAFSYTLGCIVQDSRYELKVENAERAHKASLVKVWQCQAYSKSGRASLGWGGERAQEPAMVLGSPLSKVSECIGMAMMSLQWRINRMPPMRKCLTPTHFCALKLSCSCACQRCSTGRMRRGRPPFGLNSKNFALEYCRVQQDTAVPRRLGPPDDQDSANRLSDPVELD